MTVSEATLVERNLLHTIKHVALVILKKDIETKKNNEFLAKVAYFCIDNAVLISGLSCHL